MKTSASKSNAAIPTKIRPVLRRMAIATSRIQLFWCDEEAVSCSLKRLNGPTQQSFSCKTILDAAKKHVCTLVDSFAVCLCGNYPFSVNGLGCPVIRRLGSQNRDVM
jgi:hypothetical protein